MWWYYHQDLYDKEPKRLLALVFVLGIPVSLISGLYEYTIDQVGKQGDKTLSQSDNPLLVIFFYVLIVGLTEELGKLCIVGLIAYRNEAFNEQVDGIIYAAASALGFATFENVFFSLDQGAVILLLRGPFSTLGHVLFSSLWGSGLGLAKFEQKTGRKVRLVLTGLLYAVLTHAAYDLLIAFGSKIAEWVALSSLVFLAIMFIFVSRQMSRLLKISQFNPASAVQSLRQIRRRATSKVPPRYVPNTYLRQEPENKPDQTDEEPDEETKA
jgi:RsiW-degrading membrane proteinase PrsW (M82 family)